MTLGRFVTAEYGAAAVAALKAVLTDVRRGDPLAPVDVVVPSALAGVTVRRSVAGAAGLANVRFTTMPQLAERLAARQLALGAQQVRLPLTPSARTLAVRRAIENSAGPLAHAARHRTTANLLEELIAELDKAESLSTADLSARGDEVLAIYAAYREQIGDQLTSAQITIAAIDALKDGNAPDTHVVLYLPGPLLPAEHDLVATLRDLDRLSIIDTALCDNAASTVRLTIAPDAEEEVRIAVRRIVDYLGHHPVRPERIGIAYPASVPYARLLAEQLTAAGIPHHVPSTRVLAQTIAGRVVTGLLELHRRDFPRAEVIRWMSDGPLIDTDGRRLPLARWDRLSREAGVARGLDNWQSRLAARVADAQEDAADDESRRERAQRRADDLLKLAAYVDQLGAKARDIVQAQTWPEVAAALKTAVIFALGKRQIVDHWGETTSIEQQSYDDVLATLTNLENLPTSPTPQAIWDAVTDELDRSVSAGTTLGRGVLAGRFTQFAGADLDLLIVVGMTEDAFPGATREHPILRDADRRKISPHLPTVASRRVDAATAWRAILLAAQRIELSYPRADTRSQRRKFAAPWFLEQAAKLYGAPVSAGRIDELDQPWLTSYASFDQALRQTETFGSAHELDVYLAMTGHVDDSLDRGMQATRARADGEYGIWTGQVGQLPDKLLESVDRGLSATALQNWATCPSSHFMSRVLHIRELEDRADSDTIDARDKGSLVHQVLEELLSGHLGTLDSPGIAPDEAWTSADLAQALELLDKAAAQFSELGLTGREVLWQAQLGRLRRLLGTVLAVDSRMRAQRQAWPIAVEAKFGREGGAGLTVTLPTQGSVDFSGTIDRIDATADGGLVVLDYKTGSGFGYDAIPTLARPKPGADLVDRGRKLQLLLYSLAAQQLTELPEATTSSYFWMVEQGDEQRGAVIADTDVDRLRQVLDVMVAGIRSGTYPANPGMLETWPGRESWASCRYCAFDRLCPANRLEKWESMRTAPALASYTELAEGDPR